MDFGHPETPNCDGCYRSPKSVSGTAVRMIDTAIFRVTQHGACIARNRNRQWAGEAG
jgi:hypothetical protein